MISEIHQTNNTFDIYIIGFSLSSNNNDSIDYYSIILDNNDYDFPLIIDGKLLLFVDLDIIEYVKNKLQTYFNINDNTFDMPYKTIKINRIINLIKSRATDIDDEIIFTLNYFIDILKIINFKYPSKYKLYLYNIADYLTFKNNLSDYFLNSKITDNSILNSLLWLYGVIITNVDIIRNHKDVENINLNDTNVINLLYHKTSYPSESFCQKVINQYPDLPSPHYTLGNLLLHKHKINDALNEYKLALSLKSTYLDAYIKISQIYEINKEYTESINILNLAIENNLKSPIIYFSMGMIYKKMNDNSNALYNLYKAIELNPKWDKPHIELGLLFYKQKKYSEAINEFKISIEINPINYVYNKYIEKANKFKKE